MKRESVGSDSLSSNHFLSKLAAKLILMHKRGSLCNKSVSPPNSLTPLSFPLIPLPNQILPIGYGCNQNWYLFHLRFLLQHPIRYHYEFYYFPISKSISALLSIMSFTYLSLF